MANVKSNEKITWSEMCDFLCENHDRKGVVVFKQNPTWKKQYSEKSRSYEVGGWCNLFYSNLISTSVFGNCLDGSENGVRLDWYMHADKPEERWKVDYCYILPESK